VFAPIDLAFEGYNPIAKMMMPNQPKKRTRTPSYDLNPCLGLKTTSAIRTVQEIRSGPPAAMAACPPFSEPRPKPRFAILIKDRAAPFTDEKRLASLDGEKGDKEKAQIMVRSFKIQGQTAAIGARSGLLIQGDCSRPDTSDEEKHRWYSDQTLRSPKIPVNRSLPFPRAAGSDFFSAETNSIASGRHGFLVEDLF